MDSAHFQPRQFHSDAEIIAIGEGLLNHTLPKTLWTHEAHFAATVYLLLHRPDLVLETQMRQIICSYNVAMGGENTDTTGYHETLTQFYIRLVAEFIKTSNSAESLVQICNRLVGSKMAQRDYPLEFYSKHLLFSVKARRQWTEPDIQALPSSLAMRVP